MKTKSGRQKNQKYKDIMSLLKVNNPRSILIKSERDEKNVAIKNKSKIEFTKKSVKTTKVKNEPIEEKQTEEEDTDLVMPSELFSCDYIQEKSEVKEVPGEYYFESDHEALRNNPDYLTLMKTYALLQAKKIQAVKDVEDLISARTAALKQDPRTFLTKFQTEFAKLPAAQNIPDVPDIDWDKYKIPSMTNEMVQKPETRNKNKAQESSENSSKEKVEGILDCKVERNARGQYLIRGRVFDATKPQTFNQPWTPEEQRRLEDLLIEYPSEEVEMERWKKIATCLGNRTPIQVQSRVQKYFAKLQKAGLPIPGRYKKNTPGGNAGKPLEFSDPKPSTSSDSFECYSELISDCKPKIKITPTMERKVERKVEHKVGLRVERKTESKSKRKTESSKTECKTKRKTECKTKRKKESKNERKIERNSNHKKFDSNNLRKKNTKRKCSK